MRSIPPNNSQSVGLRVNNTLVFFWSHVRPYFWILLFKASIGSLAVVFYRPHGKVMFSEGSVILFTGDKGRQKPPPVGTPLDVTWDQTGSNIIHPPVLTSSGSHCSGRYASYCNAFLYHMRLILGVTSKCHTSLSLQAATCLLQLLRQNITIILGVNPVDLFPHVRNVWILQQSCHCKPNGHLLVLPSMHGAWHCLV